MKRFASLLAVCVVSLSCSSGGSAGTCVPGQACVPGTTPNACASYATTCDASGNPTCAATPVADGTACGSGKVCLASSCITACVPNTACTPVGTADPCKTYTSSCSAQLTSSTCVVGGNQPDATPCGSGLICDVGTCRAACTAGLVCTPPGTADPCKTYASTCSSNLAQEFCGPVANRPDGTACGTPLAPLTCNSGICQAAVTPPASPTLTPPGATASPGLAVVVSHPVPTAVIFYTTDGTAPSDAPETFTPSFVGGGTITLQATAMVQAFAKVGTERSATVVGIYTIVATPPPPPPPSGQVIDLSAGFTPDKVQMNGTTTIVGTRLRLTPAATRYQFGSSFFPTPVNVQAFTTDFSFQITVDNPNNAGDGITFTIQGDGPFALGSQGGGLAYGPDPFLFGQQLTIPRSVAVKFDIYDNAGEGWNSTGIYTDGEVPSVPALSLSPSGILLTSGRVFDVHMVYDGATLSMTVTDSTSPATKFTAAFPIDIPAHTGGPTGWVGFTGSTGGLTSRLEILKWTYTNVK